MTVILSPPAYLAACTFKPQMPQTPPRHQSPLTGIAPLEGYALLKVMGKGSGLEALRRDMSVRFARPTSGKAVAPPEAT